MPEPVHRPFETGGITILVVLMLLVLLTLSSLGLSRNAFRSAIVAGTIRQVAQAENVADAGLEWAVYWVAPDPNTPGVKPAASGSALALQQAAATIAQAGSYGTPSSPITGSDLTLSTAGGNTQNFDITVTLMGTVTPFYTGMTTNNAMVAQTLLLWNLKSNGYISYANGQTYTHRREVWLTLPPPI